jgi:hypothetical protein
MKLDFDMYANIHSKFPDRPISNKLTQQLSYIVIEEIRNIKVEYLPHI